MKYPLDIFQDLYDSELNFSITSFWDAGFVVRLSDKPIGTVAQSKCDDMIEAALWLKNSALIHYPDSEFSKKYGREKK